WTKIKNKNGDYETVNYAGTSGLLLDGNKVPKTHDCINDLYDTSVTSYKTAGSRIGQYVAENVYNDEDPSKLTYCFSGLPSEITNTDTYIKISILTSSTPMFSVTKILTFSEEEYSNFTNSLLTKLNSYLFEDSSYRVIAYIKDGDLLFQVVSKNDSNKTHVINTFGTYVNVYNKVDTSTEDELLYVYQRNSDDWGASGDNILLSIKYSEVPDKSFLLKSGEVYRFGIKFYNKYGQETPPNWICDLKMPEGGNLWDGDNCLSLKVTLLRTEKLKAQGVVGWRMLRVQRTDEDKTILHQGIVSSSIFQIYDKDEIKNQQELTQIRPIDTTIYNPTGEADFKGNAVKMPTPFFRTKNDIIDFPIDKYGYINSVPSEEDWTYAKLNKLSDNRILNSNTLYMSKMEGKRDARRIQPYSEIFSTNVGFSLSSLFDAGEYNKSITIQENKLLQFYTPELLLENKDFSGITSFRVVGNLNNTENKSWGKRYAVDTQLVDGECKKEDGLNLYDIDSNDGLDLTEENFWEKTGKFIKTALSGQIERTEEPNRNFFNSNGLIGPGGNKTNYFEYQYNRIFNLLDRNASTDYSFLEEPLRVGTGERRIKYYNYTFNNDIKNIITDNNERDTKKIFDGLNEDDYSTAISSVNSVGALCYLFSTEDQQALENIPGFTGDALLVEFRRKVINQYGGNTYEDRANNTYIEIGDYNPINVRSSLILHAGDIFAGVFKFARILPNLSKIYNSAYTSICEIIEFPVETSVDLSNRTDISSKGWDFLFHPQENEFHKYNSVYSQESTATQSRGSVFYFEELKEVSNKILATKKKNPGELIDSWTDILINEQLLLDGNHGQIIKLITHNNSCLAFQEKAIANLQIQPRIQQVTTDGIGLEVGTGQILYDYNYITTSSGSVNMYSIDSTPSAIYYVDLLNKTFNRLSENGINGISDSLGLHAFFNNNLDVDTLKYS
ncbi:MAG: hypothetical protein M0R03_22860, partial [Novosphingobium sp.]|nr:hypothetical protein [Novosphingobium sp.]